MRNVYLRKFTVALFAAVLFIAGCGYTTRSLLPSNLKTIYVDNLVNGINVTAESSDKRMYRGYRPGMELEATRTIRNKYLSDGNLKIADKETADLILTGSLVDFRNEALRYDRSNDVEEYRIRLVVNLEMKNAKDGTVRWTENNFAGEALYRTTGPLVKSETTAIKEAADDLARRVVERTIEEW
ncbi:MAG: LPS assembly lipoprotein LptE [Candidatus Omnitrophota bacterium]|nr:LPS assembly lipoprotein LptE [Candidatus Omnitrophota bacterium]